MSDGSALCWPEQFPGEYKVAQKIWAEADKEYPDRKVYCACRDNEPEQPCRHCSKCGQFVADIRMISSEIGGMLAVFGQCKKHGQVCVDMHWWDFEFFEGDE